MAGRMGYLGLRSMNAGPFVYLLPEEIAEADAVGVARQAAAAPAGRKDANGLKASYAQGEAMHIIGARCELAGWRWLRPISWHALADRTTGLPDLGEFIDVKKARGDGRIVITPKALRPGWAYLAIAPGRLPRFYIKGWIWGAEALLYWHDVIEDPSRSAYFVPGEKLRPPETLMTLIHGDARERA